MEIHGGIVGLNFRWLEPETATRLYHSIKLLHTSIRSMCDYRVTISVDPIYTFKSGGQEYLVSLPLTVEET